MEYFDFARAARRHRRRWRRGESYAGASPPREVTAVLKATSHQNRNAYFKHSSDRFDSNGFQVIPATVELVTTSESQDSKQSKEEEVKSHSSPLGIHRKVGLRDSVHHGAVHGSDALTVKVNLPVPYVVGAPPASEERDVCRPPATTRSARVIRNRIRGARGDLYAEDEIVLNPSSSQQPADEVAVAVAVAGPETDTRYQVRNHRQFAAGVHATASDERARTMVQRELGRQWRRISLIRHTHPHGVVGGWDGPTNAQSVVWSGTCEDRNRAREISAKRDAVRRRWISAHRDNFSVSQSYADPNTKATDPADPDVSTARAGNWPELPLFRTKAQHPTNHSFDLHRTFQRIWKDPHPNDAAANAAAAAPTEAPFNMNVKQYARAQQIVNEQTRGRAYNLITGTALPVPPSQIKDERASNPYTTQHPSIWTIGTKSFR